MPSASSLSVVIVPSASAAAKKASSVTSLAPASTAACPNAGNTYALLACAGYKVRPPYFMGGNGLPDAKTTCPSLHRTACSNVHSAFDVGLLSGMMMGRSFSAAIFRTIVSSKAPWMVETPMSTVGLSASIAAARFGWYGTSCANATLCGCSACLGVCGASSRCLHTSPLLSMK